MDQRRHWAKQLEYAMITKSTELAKTAVRNLIKIRTWVDITGSSTCYCQSHPFLLGSPLEVPGTGYLMQAYFCQSQHLFCQDCASISVQTSYPDLKLKGTYECPVCAVFNLPNSALFGSEEIKRDWLVTLVGQAVIEEEESTLVTHFVDSPQVDVLYCCNCKDNSKNVRSVSLCGHRACLNCIKDKVSSNLASKRWKCFECDLNIFHSIIYESIANDTEILIDVYPNLDLSNVHAIFCKKCKVKFDVNPETDSVVVCNKCGNKMCTSCGMLSHLGVTCVEAAMNINEYRLQDINQKDHPDLWNEAKYAFDQFTKNRRIFMKNVKLVVNPELTRKFMI